MGRQTELYSYKLLLTYRGRLTPVGYGYQRRNEPSAFCWAVGLGSQHSQTNARTIKTGSAFQAAQTKEQHNNRSCLLGMLLLSTRVGRFPVFLGAIKLLANAGHTSGVVLLFCLGRHPHPSAAHSMTVIMAWSWQHTECSLWAFACPQLPLHSETAFDFVWCRSNETTLQCASQQELNCVCSHSPSHWGPVLFVSKKQHMHSSKCWKANIDVIN